MGATSESNCSDGILEPWFCDEEVGSCPKYDISANVSPGASATLQRITSRDRTTALFCFEVIGDLSAPPESLWISGRTGLEQPTHRAVDLGECKPEHLALQVS